MSDERGMGEEKERLIYLPTYLCVCMYIKARKRKRAEQWLLLGTVSTVCNLDKYVDGEYILRGGMCTGVLDLCGFMLAG